MSIFTGFVNGAKDFFNKVFNPKNANFNTVIPDEVKEKIFKMAKEDIFTLSQVCRSWHNLTEATRLPHLINNRIFAVKEIRKQIFGNNAVLNPIYSFGVYRKPTASEMSRLTGETKHLEEKKAKYETQLEELQARSRNFNYTAPTSNHTFGLRAV